MLKGSRRLARIAGELEAAAGSNRRDKSGPGLFGRHSTSDKWIATAKPASLRPFRLTATPQAGASFHPADARPQPGGTEMSRPSMLLAALLPILLAGALLAAPAHADGVVFVTRHAEKSLEVAGDAAPLLPEGTARARTLAGMLADAGIEELITTDALRSRQTGAPFAERTGLTPQVMTREDEVTLAGRLRANPDDKDRLIVAHTRNIPRILEALGVPDGGKVKLDPDTDYDNLFVVQLYPDRPASMVRLRYPIAPGD